jgi:hypothetical protein
LRGRSPRKINFSNHFSNSFLFGGGTKKGQQSDINQARALYQEYKKRKTKASEAATQEEAEKKKKKKR